MFIDKALVRIIAGAGGDGSWAFRREKFVPRGGPNGGDGGKGGNVFLMADPHLRTLLDFTRVSQHEAQSGEPGAGYNKEGKSGVDLILSVPCGTSIYRGPTLIADLLKPGDKIQVAKGGRGGRGNTHFKNSVRQAPKIAERGEPGETFEYELRLKVIADVGLIGMPNAGKSTLLSRLTRANPKIAAYPFTTLHPNLGVALVHNHEIVFADIPGLIEGSSEGKGLGIEFLQHIERTRVLVHVVDPLGFQQHSPKQAIKIINTELKSYSKKLGKKSQVLVINKKDLVEAEDVYKAIKKSMKTQHVFLVSGVTGEGMPDLLNHVSELVRALPVELEARPIAPLQIRLEPDFWVEKVRDEFHVKGKKVERLVAMTNFDLPEAVQRTQNILKKMGVERELASAGAMSGDSIRVKRLHFTFRPEMGFHNPPPRRPPRK